MSTAQPLPADDPAYPEALASRERELLKKRRAKASPNDTVAQAAPTLGVALSGGGIRSAVFSLGIFQSLASSNRLRRIDYLSTVSGGSYFGAFLGAMFARGGDHSTVADALNPAGPGASQVHPVAWLRQNGRFLAPRGGTDTFRIFAISLRNWLALHVVVFSLLLAFCLSVQLLRWHLLRHVPDVVLNAMNLGLAFDVSCVKPVLRWSPFLLLAGPPLLFAALCGLLYWFVSWSAQRRQWRTALTTGLSGGLLATLGLSAWAVIDTLALNLTLSPCGGKTLPEIVTMIVTTGAIATLAGGIRKILAIPKVNAALSALWSNRHLPTQLLLWPLVIAIWGAYLTAIDGLARSLVPIDLFTPLPPLVLYVLIPLLVFQALLALSPYFLNRSSQHAFYAERLVRTFVGASNPARHPQDNPSAGSQRTHVTHAIDGDDIPFSDYRYQVAENGGPLHLINTTLNETASHFGSTILRDRKGVPVVVGPCGISGGVVHHALDAPADSAPRKYWQLHPVLPEKPCHARFQMFGLTPFKSEALTLGYWTAISGAAVSTGVGSYGGHALSLLAGFTNLRLGYWWRANTVGAQIAVPGTPASDQPRWFQHGVWRPMQHYLITEFLGRFFGPHRKLWYLSDGGHSENTGALELIRRRVATIIVIDAEGSPDTPTGNLGVLVRKARQDYQAEISFDTASSSGSDPVGDYCALPPPDAKNTGPANLNITRGRVRYLRVVPGQAAESELIYVRPVLVPSDAADLLRYQRDNPDFPYQSTADQFFDEAQWESYRKLGERTGAALIF